MAPAYLSLTTVRTAARAHPYSLYEPGGASLGVVELIRRMETGAPFSPSDLPSALTRSGDERFDHHVVSVGLLFLSPAAAAIFRDHDLGEGFLWDVTIAGKDGGALPGEPKWAGLYVGAVKDNLDLAASTGVRRAFGMTSLDAMRIEMGAKHLVMTEGCSAGADVWREKALTGQLFMFFSPRLCRALEAAGLAADFDLVACRSS